MSQARVVIQQDPEAPVEKKILAQVIVDIGGEEKKSGT